VEKIMYPAPPAKNPRFTAIASFAEAVDPRIERDSGDNEGGRTRATSGRVVLTAAGDLPYKVVLTYGGAETCIADPLPRFNPISVKPGTINVLEKEEFRLQTWTNMANTTEFEGKKNGPDIHPTPTGYIELAKNIKKECGL